MAEYSCVCYIEYEDDGIVVEAVSRREAVAKAKQVARKRLPRLDTLIRCRCYTDEELEEMGP